MTHLGNVLVTGGAGYIGSHVCKVLACAGYCPVTFDDLSTGHSWAVRWGPLVRGNLNDKAQISRALTEHAPRAVIHLAGLASTAESLLFPRRYERVNVAASHTLLQALRSCADVPMIFSSTASLYGSTASSPIAEDHPLAPETPYAWSKLKVERLLHDDGRRHVILRYFNAAGADPEGEAGEDHFPETHLVPNVLAAAASNGSVRLFGDDYDTPDGTCIRDYVHVYDIAQAHLLALKRLLDGADSATFNIGSGCGTSVRQVLKAAQAVTGRPIRVETFGRRAGDPPRLVANIDKARQLLKWSPAHPDIRTQIEHAWTWFCRKQDGLDRHRSNSHHLPFLREIHE